MRTARIFSAGAVLYGAGHSAGIHAFATDPQSIIDEQVRLVLSSVDGLDEDGNPILLPRKDPAFQRVRRVFPRVLKAAVEEVSSLQAELEAEPQDSPCSPCSPCSRKHRQSYHETDSEKLRKAMVQLKRWSDDDFMVVDVNIPNAFVHGLVPTCMFIHRGLFRLVCYRPLEHSERVEVGKAVLVKRGLEHFTATVHSYSGDRYVVCSDSGEKFYADPGQLQLEEELHIIENDEQLALLLGHELGHVIHDHTEDTMNMVVLVAWCQLALLTILDPTGVFSFIVELGMGTVAKYGISLPTSRHNELEADQTGLRICARAGYDPHEAEAFFKNLRELEVEYTGSSHAWASTHPSTQARITALHRAESEAVDLYQKVRA